MRHVAIEHCVIERENNVVRVNFRREPEPPGPRFPGANGSREFGNKRMGDATDVSTAMAWATSGRQTRRNLQTARTVETLRI
jgi:hypothetical protein